MWGEGSLWLLQAVFRHARRSCALHLAVDASGVLSGDWRRP